MKQRKDDKKKTFQALALVTQLGLVMIVSIGMTTALGIWLDKKLGTSFITVILFFLGAAGGIQGVYSMVKQMDGEEDGKNDKTSEKDRQDAP
ncbi:MAG: AtpZ/AtpI family protein [Acetatifactor sp.]